MKHVRKKLFSALLACALCALGAFVPARAWADVKIDAKNFPDAGFRRWVKEEAAGGKDVLTDAQIAAMTHIVVAGEGISSLKGLEWFSALFLLDCTGNRLTELDLSKNGMLEVLYCENNALTELDLSRNPALWELRCTGNPITELDLSHNTKLEEARLPETARVTLPNGDRIDMADFQLRRTAAGKYQLDLSRYAAKISHLGVHIPGAVEDPAVPMTSSGGIYTFDPCEGYGRIVYEFGDSGEGERSWIILYLDVKPDISSVPLVGAEAPKGKGADASGMSSVDDDDEDEEVGEEIAKLSVTLVNKTDAEVFVALASQPDDGGDAFIVGWFNVEPGKEITVPFDSFNSGASFGYYAESNGGKRVWTAKPGDARYAGSFWVHPSDAFESRGGEPIDGGMEVGFRRLKVSSEGKATLNFTVKE